MGTYQEMIADVRESRVRMSEKCGHDVERLLDYLHSFEMKHAKQVKLFEPGRLLPPGRPAERPLVTPPIVTSTSFLLSTGCDAPAGRSEGNRQDHVAESGA